MSLLDVRQDSLIFQLFLLANESANNKKSKILEDMQKLIDNLTAEQIFIMLKKYLNLKEGHVEKEFEEKIKSHISTMMNHHQLKNGCEALLKVLSEQKNTPFMKNGEYTKYLIACDEYEKKTGNKLSQDKTQSIDTQDNTNVHPIETQANASAKASEESEKSPVFIDKRDYENGSVTIYHGINHNDFIELQEKIVTDLNESGKGPLKFVKTERGCEISGESDGAFSRFEAERKRRLEEKYNIFKHDTEKKEKKIPEKYHIPSEDTLNSYTNKMR